MSQAALAQKLWLGKKKELYSSGLDGPLMDIEMPLVRKLKDAAEGVS
jgi:hypothetical protein